MSTSKRHVLTLKQRVAVIEKAHQGQSARAIAKSLGVGKTQIQSVLLSKDNILAEWKAGKSGEQKRLSVPSGQYGNLNDLVYDWFCGSRARGLPITGPLLQEEALKIAKAIIILC